MCGRFTVKATWAELVALYRLTMDVPPHNLRPRYNVCPTDPIDVVTAEEGKRELVPMRWGLVPRWWSKTVSPVHPKSKQFRLSQRLRGGATGELLVSRIVGLTGNLNGTILLTSEWCRTHSALIDLPIEYRQRAKACLDWATQTANQEARLVCLQLAQAWLKAAMDEESGEPPTRT